MNFSVREQIRSMLQLQPREGGFAATLTIREDFSVFPDHFAGDPLMPGMCMVQAVLLAAGDLQLRTLKTAKWMQPVRPGDRIFIEGTVTRNENGELAIKAKLLRHDQRCAEFS